MTSMSASKVDQATFDKLLEAYRIDPGNHSAASRHANVVRRTARRAWEYGNEAKGWRAIKDLVAEDAELAKSRTQLDVERAELDDEIATSEADRDREAVRQHAIAARREEGMMLILARQTSIKALVAAAATSEGLKLAMGRIGKELAAIAEGGPLTKKEMMELSNITRRYSATLKDVIGAGQMAMEMERLYHGEPTEIIGVQTDLDTMPLDELKKLAGYQDGVIQRAAERGLLVLDGGLKKAASGN